MKYNFAFTEKGEASFAAIARVIQKRIFNKLQFFIQQKDPFIFAKKLAGAQALYRFRVGDYRIIFSPVSDNEITILLITKVGHRKDVYNI